MTLVMVVYLNNTKTRILEIVTSKLILKPAAPQQQRFVSNIA